MNRDRTFPRPHRTWDMRLVNALGAGLRRLGMPLGRLAVEPLLETARRRVGLSDLGDPSFRESLGVLVRSFDDEADLNMFGRLAVRENLVNLLVSRLCVTEDLKRHPEVLDAPVRRPLIVAALPRTGTTLLYNLLAQDPAARPLLYWESAEPALAPAEIGRTPDPRIRRAIYVRQVTLRLAPSLRSMHEFEPEGPEECGRLLYRTLVSSYPLAEAHLPGYADWFLQAPAERLETAYHDYRRQLQLLQWYCPPTGHWVLKSPAHMYSLAALWKMLPDACVVQTHRDPCQVLPSACSLVCTYRGILSDAVRPADVGAELTKLTTVALRRCAEARQQVAPDRVYDVAYGDLIRDPIEVVRRIYAHFGYAWTEQFECRARRWLADNPRGKHGPHQYHLEQFGLRREQVLQTFESYMREHGIAPEVP